MHSSWTPPIHFDDTGYGRHYILYKGFFVFLTNMQCTDGFFFDHQESNPGRFEGYVQTGLVVLLSVTAKCILLLTNSRGIARHSKLN